ncbi:MAG: PH domain-containing protein [Planctomycetales bacterium]|nr:PH domain-containing protein [Planctomycetales bacterium]
MQIVNEVPRLNTEQCPSDNSTTGGGSQGPPNECDEKIASPASTCPFRQLSSQFVAFERRTSCIFSACALLIVIAITVPLLAFSSIIGVWFPALVVLGWCVLAGLLIFFAWYWPPLAFKHIHWRLTHLGMEIHRGVYWQHQIVVPLVRVQHVDVSQGPVQRLFGLGTLAIHTAGTKEATVELSGLDHTTAMSVRDRLIDYKESLDVL